MHGRYFRRAWRGYPRERLGTWSVRRAESAPYAISFDFATNADTRFFIARRDHAFYFHKFFFQFVYFIIKS